MLTGPDDTNRWDRACVALAALTLSHCLLAAPLGTLAAVLAGEAAHVVLAGVTLATSIPGITRGWLVHRNPRAFGWAIPGWALLVAARLGNQAGFEEAGEVVATVWGGALLIVAHQLNRSLGYWHQRD